MFRKRKNYSEKIYNHTSTSWSVIDSERDFPKIFLLFCFFLSGVEDSQVMRVSLGISEVFVTFRVKPSDKFRREKEDIHSDVDISITQATLGGTIKVPGIYEDHVLKVR